MGMQRLCALAFVASVVRQDPQCFHMDNKFSYGLSDVCTNLLSGTPVTDTCCRTDSGTFTIKLDDSCSTISYESQDCSGEPGTPVALSTYFDFEGGDCGPCDGAVRVLQAATTTGAAASHAWVASASASVAIVTLVAMNV